MVKKFLEEKTYDDVFEILKRQNDEFDLTIKAIKTSDGEEKKRNLEYLNRAIAGHKVALDDYFRLYSAEWRERMRDQRKRFSEEGEPLLLTE